MYLNNIYTAWVHILIYVFKNVTEIAGYLLEKHVKFIATNSTQK